MAIPWPMPFRVSPRGLRRLLEIFIVFVKIRTASLNGLSDSAQTGRTVSQVSFDQRIPQHFPNPERQPGGEEVEYFLSIDSALTTVVHPRIPQPGPKFFRTPPQSGPARSDDPSVPHSESDFIE